ncbi:hypothetical protein E4631_09440 [Hymenobacter sp. UV11]|uniref:hypothetical protein n=1 Tax=Hymenobacter sp. UV11 TaxID=1849735 RepID=UPI00105BC0CC|nr:hypothetical protein [Hymenobacter sp. UV11]TDN39721.1 hypothetical protein A8B98_17245 [Hymenobacter sp. UV11]TFZ67161.1 hypothetical protein E4631_09440 [Hymenobacter sp. UV11]
MAVDIAQIQQVLENAQQADAFKADVKRALRKVSSLVSNLQQAVEEAETLLSADYVPAIRERKARAPREISEADADAPYGRKKDGTPKGKPGRTKQ